MSVRFGRQLFVAVSTLALCATQLRAQTPVTWTQGTAGNWNQTANWTGLVGGNLFPNNGANTYTVTIAGTAGQATTTSVTFDVATGAPANTITLSGLTLAPVLDVAGNPAAELVLGAGVTLNAGALGNFSGTTLSGGRYFLNGTLKFTGASIQTLAAGTTLIMNNAAAAVLNQTNNANALANFANNQGIFDIRNGFNHTANAAFVNSGLVSTSEGSVFTVNNTLTNSGTLLASGVSGTGTININNSNVNNTGGNLNAGNNGIINIHASGITLGTLTTSGNGVIRFSNTASNTLSQVAVNGTIDLASNTGVARVFSDMALNGTINVNQNSVLAFQGTQALSGTGTIVLGNTGSSNRVSVDGSNSVLTLGSGITIRGDKGTIGTQTFVSTGNSSIKNDGRITADVSGGAIVIGQATVSNFGVLEANNGGTLGLQSNVTNSAQGQINAHNGGVIQQHTSTITGGTINTTTGGKFVATNNTNNIFTDVTLNGNVDLASATGVLRVIGGAGLTLTNNSLIDINQNSVLAFQGNQLFTGNGTVVFGGTGASNRLSLDASNSVLTIGSNIRIRGENGTIGAQAFVSTGNSSIVNNGRISADVSGGSINITQATVTNNGILEALNGGTLVLSSNVTGGPSGQILAGTGSTVLQNAIKLSGTINTSGSGNFRPTNSSSNFVDGVTLSGTLDMASATAQERVLNGFTLNGTVNINQNSVMTFEGTQTLGGIGNIILGSTGSSNRVGVDVSNSVLTIGQNVTIRGENGTIGAQTNHSTGGSSIINNGRISADVNGGSINITQAKMNNLGILEAQNGGTLFLSSDLTANSTGQILAGANSLVMQNAIRMSGTINTSGSGLFRPTNSSSNFLDAATVNGNIDMAGATAIERVVNGLTLNGKINVNQNSVLVFEGTQAIGGTGIITLGGTGGNNRVGVDMSGSNVTLGAGVLIHGENGTVGAQAFQSTGNSIFTNNGTISADVLGGTITLAQSAFANNNVLEAKDGGTLNINTTTNNSGTGVMNASNNGVVLQNAATITGGTINTTTGGRFVATNSTSNIMNGTTVNGHVDLATAVGIIRVIGAGGLGMQANGLIEINSNSILAMQGDQTISGTGTIAFGNTGSNNRFAIDGSNSTLTIGSNILVHGVNGTIGNQAFVSTGNVHLVNDGTINSDGGGLITISNANLTSVVNNGTMRAENGTLSLGLPVSGTGTLQVDATGIMNMGATGANTQNRLLMGDVGAVLNTANRNITINGDYTNIGAGVGNAFNRRAGINGTGQILAGGNAAQALTGAQVTNGTTTNATMTIGNVRVGTTLFNYGVANTGTTGPVLRGAVQTSVNGANISDARLSGGGVTAQNFGPVALGSTSAALDVGFTAAVAGVLAPLNGQAVNVRSNFDNIADQKLNIVLGAGAAAYNIAVGSTTPTPVNLGNARVGGVLSGNLTVANTAPAGLFSEKLDATFGANTGSATNNGGAISLLAAGSNNNTLMGVGLTTTTAGARTGTVRLDYVSNGLGTSGLGTIGAGNQIITVNGGVYNLATGAATPTPVNLGNARVGGVLRDTLTVTNTAAVGAFTEKLDVAFGANTGSATNFGGVINLLTAGANNSTAMAVGLTTTTAGAHTGTVTLNYSSNGLGTSGLATIANGSQVVTVNGNVFNAAVGAATPSPINLGNTRIGGTLAGNLTVANTATAGAFSERLDAVFGANTGAATNNGGSISLLNAGSNNNTNMGVGLTTGTAGAITGTVALNYSTNGTGTSGLASAAAGNQVVTVNGGVYQSAVGQLNSAPLNFGTVQVGQTVSQFLSITNAAAGTAGFVEDLGVAFGASAGVGANQIVGSGSIASLLAGATNTNTMQVSVNTSIAGAINGTIAVNYTSLGTVNAVSNGLGTLAVGNSQYVVNGIIQGQGQVINTANPVINNAPINLGNVRIGSASPVGLVSVTNQASAPPQAALNATIAGNGQITASGSFNLLNPGATNAASLQVGMNTATAGLKNNNATLSFVSDANNVGNCTPNCQLNLPSQNVAVNGAVYRLANPVLNTSSVALVARVGDAAPTASLSVTNSSPDAFTERLDASFASAPTGFNTSGSIVGLAAAANSTALGVSLNTATAGTFSGSTFVDFVSSGAGTTNAANISVGSGSVGLTGKVYTAAVGQVNTSTVDFGIVHVGDVLGPMGVSVTNGAVPTALNDVLTGDITTGSAGFTATGNLGSGVTAGSTNAASLNVALNTANAAVYNGSASVNLKSHNPDLADLNLGSTSVTLKGQVNNYAMSLFQKLSGAGSLTQNAGGFRLSFGSVQQGTSNLLAGLGVANAAAGPADLLGGNFSFGQATAFALSGFGSFTGISAGSVFSGLGINFNTSTLGRFSQVVTLHSFGFNASGYNANLADLQLTIDGDVIGSSTCVDITVPCVPPISQVPEPGTMVLMVAGLAVLALVRRRYQLRKTV